MAKERATYKSYLLRVWQEGGDGRIRIHFAQIGKEPNVRHFADLDSFIGHLLSLPQLNAETAHTEHENKETDGMNK